ncbi:MAG: sulfatase [Muribaculaceae bacterium]
MKNQVLLTAGLLAGSALAQGQEKPNIVIIYSDDMGVGDVSYLNSKWVNTPNIDRLAAEGRVMTHYYTASPVSSPSRVSLTTGMFPSQWGINTFLHEREKNRKHEQFDYLDPNAPSMARSLKAAGYRTAHIGKWHMGGGRDVDDAPQIPRYGFDEYVSTWESPNPDKLITSSNWIWSETDSIKRWERTHYFVDRALDFLRRNRGEACFVNLWPDDMHDPWIPSAKYYEKRWWQTREAFTQVLETYDRELGRFFDGLKELGIWENTIVIFTADNGPAPSYNQLRTNGLRGQKISLYEGGLNMPFIISWPGHIEPSIDNSTVVSSVDIYPSLCKIVGAECPDTSMLSGEDMSDALLGQCIKSRTKDLMWDYGRSPVFNQPAKERNRSPHLAIRRGDFKLLVNADGSRLELYNIVNDPYELENIADKHHEMCQELSAKVIDWFNTKLRRRL